MHPDSPTHLGLDGLGAARGWCQGPVSDDDLGLRRERLGQAIIGRRGANRVLARVAVKEGVGGQQSLEVRLEHVNCA